MLVRESLVVDDPHSKRRTSLHFWVTPSWEIRAEHAEEAEIWQGRAALLDALYYEA